MAELREAIVAQWRRPSEETARLRRALVAAAAEARTRGLRPEELVDALRSLESELATLRAGDDPAARRRLREWLVARCIEAYFGTSGPPER